MAQIEANTLADLLAFAAQHHAVVVDFYATWCGPCVRIGPYVHNKAQQTGLALAKVNVDVNQEASTRYGIQAMPTFIVIDAKGNVVHKVTGGSEGNVNQCFEKAKQHLEKEGHHNHGHGHGHKH